MVALLEKDAGTKRVLQVTNQLCTAYNSLAYYDINHLKGTTQLTEGVAFPARCDLNAVKSLRDLPIMTCPPPVDPSARYSNFVRIHAFDKSFKMYGAGVFPQNT